MITDRAMTAEQELMEDWCMDHNWLEQMSIDLIQTQLKEHWEELIRDCNGDLISIGGQSLEELQRLSKFEKFLLQFPQMEIPTFHHFADGVYIRECHAPKHAVIIGHLHRTECLNIMSQGRVLTINNGKVLEFVAPLIIKSGPYTRKASVVVESMRWSTCHPNHDNCTDIPTLEERHLIKS